MAQRTLDTAFWDDESVAYLSRNARLLFACMVTDTSLTDDYGVLPASPMILRKHAFGYDDDLSVEDVRRLRDEIVRMCRNVILREINGQEYILLKNFDKWQNLKYQRKTAYPSPDEFAQIPEKVPQIPEKVPESGEEIPMSSVESCSDELSSEKEGGDASLSPAPSDFFSGDDPTAGLPVGTDGHQRAVDKASGAKVDPVEEVARHHYWGFMDKPGIPLPAGKQRHKWVKAGERLLNSIPPPWDLRAVCARIDCWWQDGKLDDFWKDKPCKDDTLDLIAKFVVNGGKHARPTEQRLDEQSRQISEAFTARARSPGPGT